MLVNFPAMQDALNRVATAPKGAGVAVGEAHV